MAPEEKNINPEGKIIELIKEHFKGQLRPQQNVNLESRFIEDLGADSLDTVDLIMKVEDEYKVKIGDEVIPSLKTIRNLVNYVANYNPSG